MGYVGTKPTAAPLTTSQLEDGLVTAAKLATDAVETAKVKDVNVTAGKLAATQDLSTKTITLPASVAGLGTGITNAQLAGSIDVTSKITGVVPAANLGSGTASASTYLAGNQTYQTISEYDDSVVQSNIAMLGFKVAVNGSLTRYNLVDQSIDEFYDTSGVDASASTNEIRTASGSNFYYDGGTSATITQDADATGTDGDYTWYKWTDTGATGSYQTSVAQNHDIFVLAGGAGGGPSDGGGGGGAGGFKYYKQKTDVGTGSTTITVGAGGAGGIGANGTNGSNSSFGSLIATGGGGGGNHKVSGTVGGSGGGAGGRDGATGAAGTANQGNAGGDSAPGTSTSDDGGGGGGGAGGVGADGTNSNGGNGGVGYTEGTSTVYDWFADDGSTETFDIDGLGVGYAGGGGSGSDPSGGSGGTGTDGGADAGDNAVANRGGGGGGTQSASIGAGGSGVVIVRRLTSGGATTGEDLTLQSTDVTAGAEPDFGEFVTLIENAYGTATLNTDIKGYISRDSGTTFTQGTLVDEGSWGTNKKVLGFHDLDISSQPSGTSMCYKITTHNQSASSKETRVYATSIGWR